MHAVIAIFYALIITMAADLYALVALPEWAGWVFVMSPLIVSGTIVVLLLLDWLVARLCSMGSSVCHFASIWRMAIRKYLITR